MKKQETDRLRSLFQDIELSNPTQGFEDRLMQQIHRAASETKAKNIFRNQLYTALSIASGVAAIIALPLIVFYFTMGEIGLELPTVKFDFSIFHFPEMNINPLTVLLPFVVLILLMGDTLIRKHISDKKQHNT